MRLLGGARAEEAGTSDDPVSDRAMGKESNMDENNGKVITLGAPSENDEIAGMSRMTDDYMAFLEAQDSAENASKTADNADIGE